MLSFQAMLTDYEKSQCVMLFIEYESLLFADIVGTD